MPTIEELQVDERTHTVTKKITCKLIDVGLKFAGEDDTNLKMLSAQTGNKIMSFNSSTNVDLLTEYVAIIKGQKRNFKKGMDGIYSAF